MGGISLLSYDIYNRMKRALLNEALLLYKIPPFSASIFCFFKKDSWLNETEYILPLVPFWASHLVWWNHSFLSCIRYTEHKPNLDV